MFISVEELAEHPVKFDEAIPPGAIDYSSDELQQSAPLLIKGTARLIVDEIDVRGQLSTKVETACARCLEPVEQPVQVNFDLVYKPESRIARSEEIAVPRGEEEVGFYRGGGLLLEDIAKEQVLLSLPMRTVCREGACLGLCPVCGRNRNRDSCDCKPAAVDTRWWEGLKK